MTWPLVVAATAELRDTVGNVVGAAELVRRVRATALTLTDFVVPGSPVLTAVGDDVPSVVLLLAATVAGLVPVAVDGRALSVLQIRAAVESTGAALCLTTMRERALAGHCEALGVQLVDVSGPVRHQPLPVAVGVERSAYVGPGEGIGLGEPWDDRLVLTTSGTSGEPKAAVLGLRNMEPLLAGLAARLPLTPDDVVFNPLSIAHSYGLSNVLHGLSCGATVLLRPLSLFPLDLVEDVRASGATVFAGVPTHYEMLCSLDDGTLASNMGAVRATWCAGDAMPEPITRRLRAVLPDTELYLMYGQTEASSRISILDPARVDSKPLSVGTPLPGAVVRVVNESGRVVPTGVSGEVVVDAPYLMRGYWPTRSPFGSVLHTGDIGYLDGDGDLFVTGRISSFAKVSGEKVPLQMVDAVVREVWGVADAAVQVDRRGGGGDVLRALVVLDANSDGPTGEEIKHYVWRRTRRVRLADVVVAETLPRTSTGKLVRFFRHQVGQVVGEG